MAINKKHPFRKKWGQNFLRDHNTIEKIIGCLNPQKTDHILEIGPGDGALTNLLFTKVNLMTVIEIDPLLTSLLKQHSYYNVVIHEKDILNWDLSTIHGRVKILGNLPYYISSPILFKMLNWQKWERMVLMFQKELAQRIVADHGNKSYGRISVVVQVYCDVKINFFVSNNVFHPRPDVDSAVLTFTPKEEKLPELQTFSSLVKRSFSNRRKKIKNNLKEEFKSNKIDKWSNLRAEEISPNEYISLYNSIYIA